jgi:ferredoxin
MKHSGPADVLGERLSRSGLALRGGFDFDDGEASPPLHSGKPSKAVILIGNIGGAFWPHFKLWRDNQPADLKNPLDSWSRAVIEQASAGLGATFISPSDKPFMPFQQWAMRAEGLRPSPLGILMHPRWGLWHAYRGALLFDRPLGLAEPGQIEHLCDSCVGKPCVRACPVYAYTADRFDHTACLDHVRGARGGLSYRRLS